MNKDIRVRFAPSPTGNMHIGNMRTAIINYIFAKKNKGKFFLRIEDTDNKRSTEESLQEMMKIFTIMNINFDLYDINPYNHEKYIKQSTRYEIYNNIALKLLKKGSAYYCQCDSLPSDSRCNCRNLNLNKGVLRFKVIDDQEVIMNDIVFGKMIVNTKEIEDFALLRSDHSPTYNFSVVVDDNETKITHIIRGEDHRTNSLKQILLYNALGYELPIFCHLPMILGEDGKKMSKRKGDWSIKTLINEGFLPSAIFNILIKLGWGYKNEEIFNEERILEIFELKDIRSSSCVFDRKKLYNFNGKHIRKYDNKKYIIEFLENYFKKNLPMKKFNMLYEEICKRSNTLVEFAENIEFIFKDFNSLPKVLQKVIGEKKIESFEELDQIIRTQENSQEIIKEVRKYFTNKEFGIHIKFFFEIYRNLF